MKTDFKEIYKDITSIIFEVKGYEPIKIMNNGSLNNTSFYILYSGEIEIDYTVISNSNSEELSQGYVIRLIMKDFYEKAIYGEELEKSYTLKI